jgi:hypothetical protein
MVTLLQVDGACRSKRRRRHSAAVPMDGSSGAASDDSLWGRKPSSIAGQTSPGLRNQYVHEWILVLYMSRALGASIQLPATNNGG